MQNLQADLEAALSADASLLDDQGALIKSEVNARAARLDAGLLKLLLASDTLRSHFFTDIDGTLVFDKVKFAEFVANKAFLPDSYTAFRNRIGLTDGAGRYLKDSDKVVLAWPYKDCVLEGGMTREDTKRDEVFWNTTLAPDDVTRLFEPKVLTGFERWDAEAVEKGEPKPVEAIDPEADNLLIKGNNLLALHSLKTRYAGQVKLIYIDPPYNTGSDEFRYNDRFLTASWLSFLQNRLEVAKSLLAVDGILLIQLSDHRVAEGKLLLDEIFGRDNFVNQVSVKTPSPSGFKTVNLGVFESAEYLLLYAQNKREVNYLKQYEPVEYDQNYKFYVINRNADRSKWEIVDIQDAALKKLRFGVN